MDIKIYEVVCCNGSKLGNILDRALDELEIRETYEIVTDMHTILNQGILSPPTLVIDGKIYLTGRIPSVEQVKEAVVKASKNH